MSYLHLLDKKNHKDTSDLPISTHAMARDKNRMEAS